MNKIIASMIAFLVIIIANNSYANDDNKSLMMITGHISSGSGTMIGEFQTEEETGEDTTYSFEYANHKVSSDILNHCQNKCTLAVLVNDYTGYIEQVLVVQSGNQ